jgi:uncharacterized membrane protein
MMPIIIGPLVAWLTSVITAVIVFLTQFIGKKLAMIAIFVSLWIAFVVAFAAAINALLNTIAVSIPAGGVITAGISMLPANMDDCIAAIISGHIIASIYVAKAKILNIKVTV